jgi:hypothetical protein
MGLKTKSLTTQEKSNLVKMHGEEGTKILLKNTSLEDLIYACQNKKQHTGQESTALRFLSHLIP